jgi:hypothetical protein
MASAVVCLKQYEERIAEWIETNIEIEKTFNLVEDV